MSRFCLSGSPDHYVWCPSWSGSGGWMQMTSAWKHPWVGSDTRFYFRFATPELPMLFKMWMTSTSVFANTICKFWMRASTTCGPFFIESQMTSFILGKFNLLYHIQQQFVIGLPTEPTNEDRSKLFFHFLAIIKKTVRYVQWPAHTCQHSRSLGHS